MKITFDNNVSFETEEEQITLFEVSRQMSIPVAFGCRIGNCGVCLVLIEGKKLSKKTKEEKEWTKNPKQRLACQCIIKGDADVSRV